MDWEHCVRSGRSQRSVQSSSCPWAGWSGLSRRVRPLICVDSPLAFNRYLLLWVTFQMQIELFSTRLLILPLSDQKKTSSTTHTYAFTCIHTHSTVHKHTCTDSHWNNQIRLVFWNEQEEAGVRCQIMCFTFFSLLPMVVNCDHLQHKIFSAGHKTALLIHSY